jgi:hypothetical protein
MKKNKTPKTQKKTPFRFFQKKEEEYTHRQRLSEE